MSSDVFQSGREPGDRRAFPGRFNDRLQVPCDGPIGKEALSGRDGGEVAQSVYFFEAFSTGSVPDPGGLARRAGGEIRPLAGVEPALDDETLAHLRESCACAEDKTPGK